MEADNLLTLVVTSFITLSGKPALLTSHWITLTHEALGCPRSVEYPHMQLHQKVPQAWKFQEFSQQQRQVGETDLEINLKRGYRGAARVTDKAAGIITQLVPRQIKIKDWGRECI